MATVWDWVLLSGIVIFALWAAAYVALGMRKFIDSIAPAGAPLWCRWLRMFMPFWPLIANGLMLAAAWTLVDRLFLVSGPANWSFLGLIAYIGGAVIAAVKEFDISLPGWMEPGDGKGATPEWRKWLKVAFWPVLAALWLVGLSSMRWVGPVAAFIILVWTHGFGGLGTSDRSMIWWEAGSLRASAPQDRLPCEELHLRYSTTRTDADGTVRRVGIPAAQCVKVHYATPRAPVGTSSVEFDPVQFPDEYRVQDYDTEISAAVGSRLSYGSADVSLPLPVDYDKVVRDDDDDGLYNRDQLNYLSQAKSSDEVIECEKNAGPKACEWLRLSRFAFVTEITRHGATQTFTNSLGKELQKASPAHCRTDPYAAGCDNRRGVLLFVHGYNQKFEDTIVRAAQLALDLDLTADGHFNVTYDANGGEKRLPVRPTYRYGAPILFSWPNGEEVLTYFKDRDKALASAKYLYELLLVLAQNPDIDDINIVVHSMGHRVFVNMIETFVTDYLASTPTGELKRIRIVHAAGDVSDSSYDDLMARADVRFDDRDDAVRDANIPRLPYAAPEGEDNAFPQIAIYKSNKDMALLTSAIMKLRQRLGLVLPPLTGRVPTTHAQEYMTTINVRGASTDLLGHGYFSSDGNILNDIACFIRNDPNEMPYRILTDRQLKAKRTKDGAPYYDLEGGRETHPSPCRPTLAPFVVADIAVMQRALGYSYLEFAEQRTEYLEDATNCTPRPDPEPIEFWWPGFEETAPPPPTKPDVPPLRHRPTPGPLGQERERSVLEDDEDGDIAKSRIYPPAVNRSGSLICTKNDESPTRIGAPDPDNKGATGPTAAAQPDTADTNPVDISTLVEGAVIYFPPGSEMLVCEAREQLRAVADFVRQFDVVRIRIEGHSDTEGAGPDNYTLSESRARATAIYLSRVLGVSSALIVEVVGRGETSPAEITDDRTSNVRNRRVEIRIDYRPPANAAAFPTIPSVWSGELPTQCPNSLGIVMPTP